MLTPKFSYLIHRYGILRISAGPRGVDLQSILRTLAWSIVLPAAVCLGALLDQTWELDGNAKGLGEHLGFWAWVVTTPLIVELAVLILACFLETMKGIDRFTIKGRAPLELRRLIVRHLKSLSLRSNSRFILFFFCLIGFFFSLLNIRETIQPAATYGNIVFDSYPFLRGFLLTKMYLLLLWTLIFPTVLFVALHVTISLSFILKYMCDHNVLKIDFFHRDNCGGLSVFGFINTLIMAVYAAVLLVIICLDLTHSRRYSTLLLSLFSTSALLLLQSVVTVYYIHKCAKAEKNKSLAEINAKLGASLVGLGGSGNDRFASDLLSLRSHLLSLHTFPYAKPVSVTVDLLRFVPALIAVGKLVASGGKFTP